MDKEQQEKYLDEALKRAGAFEEMINTQGWEHVKSWYQARLAVFINDTLGDSSKPLADFESERSELAGIKSLLSLIDGDLETLRKFREEQNANGTK